MFVLYVSKILNGLVETELSETVNNCRRINTYPTRDMPRRDIPENSSLYKGMTYVNSFRNQFDIDDALLTIRSKLKRKYYLILFYFAVNKVSKFTV